MERFLLLKFLLIISSLHDCSTTLGLHTSYWARSLCWRVRVIIFTWSSVADQVLKPGLTALCTFRIHISFGAFKYVCFLGENIGTIFQSERHLKRNQWEIGSFVGKREKILTLSMTTPVGSFEGRMGQALVHSLLLYVDSLEFCLAEQAKGFADLFTLVMFSGNEHFNLKNCN